MKLNLKFDLKFHRFAIYFFFQIEILTFTVKIQASSDSNLSKTRGLKKN